MAATIAKSVQGALGSQFAPFSNSDVVWEVVRVTADGTTATIECGGATPQTSRVRTPLHVFCQPINQDGATVATYLVYPVWTTSTLITLTATDAADVFDVLIIGLPV